MGRRGTSPASPASSATRGWTAARCARGRARYTAGPATARISGQKESGLASVLAASQHPKVNLQFVFMCIYLFMLNVDIIVTEMILIHTTSRIILKT